MSQAYYDTSYPPSLWETLVVIPATGATAGIPGTWTPAGSDAPASVAALQGAAPAIVATPATLWTTGQYVQTKTAGVAGRASWSGTAWVTGAAPLANEADQTGETIASVKTFVQTYPDEAQRVRNEEAQVQSRSTLLAWLDDFLATNEGNTA